MVCYTNGLKGIFGFMLATLNPFHRIKAFSNEDIYFVIQILCSFSEKNWANAEGHTRQNVINSSHGVAWYSRLEVQYVQFQLANAHRNADGTTVSSPSSPLYTMPYVTVNAPSWYMSPQCTCIIISNQMQSQKVWKCTRSLHKSICCMHEAI